MQLNIAFFASHGGSNMQAILDNIFHGRLKANASLFITNNSNSLALERAKSANIPSYHISSKTHSNDDNRIEHTIELLDKYNCNIIVLAGYMKILEPKIIRHLNNRVLNIHPALLPKFGGEGMFGMNVHRSVIEHGEKFSGATVHIVDEVYDNGKILNQMSINILENDTAESLAGRVLKIEHILYSDTLKKIENSRILI